MTTNGPANGSQSKSMTCGTPCRATLATSVASRWNRSATDGLSATPGRSTFTATRRCTASCVAENTAPIPPSPTSCSSA